MSSPTTEQQTIIFLHIPKTAGTTLHAILQQQFGPQRILHLVGDPHIDTAVRRLQNIDEATKLQIKLLTGHFPFGIHQYLPQPATYFTLLRHPVERVLSYYYFILRTPAHPRHQEMVAGDIDLLTFAREILTHNNQTRMIAGLSIDDPQPCTTATLELAKRHIQDHFFLVGLTEKFSDSMLLLQRQLGWRKLPVYQRRNVAADRPAPSALTIAEKTAVSETQSFDLALYTFAAKRLQEQLSSWGWGYRYAAARRRLQLYAQQRRG